MTRGQKYGQPHQYDATLWQKCCALDIWWCLLVINCERFQHANMTLGFIKIGTLRGYYMMVWMALHDVMVSYNAHWYITKHLWTTMMWWLAPGLYCATMSPRQYSWPCFTEGKSNVTQILRLNVYPICALDISSYGCPKHWSRPSRLYGIGCFISGLCKIRAILCPAFLLLFHRPA